MNEYATGLIRVLEKEITDKSDFARMMDAAEAKTAFNVLNDTDLKDNLLGLNAEDFETAIERDNLNLKKLVKKFANRALYRLIFLEDDFFNLKLAIKENFFGVSFEKNEFSSLGTINPIKLKKALKNEIKFANYRPLQKSIAALKKLAKQEKKRKFLETAADAEYFQCALALSREIKNAVILNFYKRAIDTANIKNIFRAKKIGLSIAETKKQLAKGGAVSIKQLADIIKNQEQDIINFLKKQVEFSKEWENIWEGLSSDYNIVLLEKNLDLFVLNCLEEEIKKIASGPEIIFSYAIVKKAMNANIRLIMTGKINNIPAEEIQTRLKI